MRQTRALGRDEEVGLTALGEMGDREIDKRAQVLWGLLRGSQFLTGSMNRVRVLYAQIP